MLASMAIVASMPSAYRGRSAATMYVFPAPVTANVTPARSASMGSVLWAIAEIMPIVAVA